MYIIIAVYMYIMYIHTLLHYYIYYMHKHREVHYIHVHVALTNQQFPSAPCAMSDIFGSRSTHHLP